MTTGPSVVLPPPVEATLGLVDTALAALLALLLFGLLCWRTLRREIRGPELLFCIGVLVMLVAIAYGTFEVLYLPIRLRRLAITLGLLLLGAGLTWLVVERVRKGPPAPHEHPRTEGRRD